MKIFGGSNDVKKFENFFPQNDPFSVIFNEESINGIDSNKNEEDKTVRIKRHNGKNQ
jgi:hypothetical protein